MWLGEIESDFICLTKEFVLCLVDNSHRRILNLRIFHKYYDGSMKEGYLKEVGLDEEKPLKISLQ